MTSAGWTTTRSPRTAKSNSQYISATNKADAGYIKFATSSLPDDAVITAADVRIGIRSTAARVGGFQLYRTTASWSPATLTNANRPGRISEQLNSTLVRAVAGRTVVLPIASLGALSKTAPTSIEFRYSQPAVGTLLSLRAPAPMLRVTYKTTAAKPDVEPTTPPVVQPTKPPTVEPTKPPVVEPTTPPSASALPFAVPRVGSTAKKVFAHYFPPYPVSFDNADPSVDYYARNYLTVNGENGKHVAYSGLLRDRPEGRTALTGDWKAKDFNAEIDDAVASGVDGFMVDVLSLQGGNWERTVGLTNAAAARTDGFKVIPNIDATSSVASASPATIAAAMAPLMTSRAAYKLPDGRVLLSSFKAEGKSAAWWKQLISELSSKHGVKAAFVAVFLDSSEANLRSFAPFTYAASNWGKRSPDSVRAASDRTSIATELGMKWIEPIGVQDVRPKSGIYAEAANTETLRGSWQRAIANDADFAQLITWNDYSEGTSFARSQTHGTAFLDLSAYYASWFKTGSAPKLTGDELILTNRAQFSSAVAQLPPVRLSATLGSNLTKPRDQVEVVSILSKPATVTVKVGSATHVYDAPAGVTARTFALQTGKVSVSASRSGTSFASATSAGSVVAAPRVTNLLYWGATSR